MLLRCGAILRRAAGAATPSLAAGCPPAWALLSPKDVAAEGVVKPRRRGGEHADGASPSDGTSGPSEAAAEAAASGAATSRLPSLRTASLTSTTASASSALAASFRSLPAAAAARALALAADMRDLLTQPSFTSLPPPPPAAALEGGFRGWWGCTRGRHDAAVAAVALFVTATRARQAMAASSTGRAPNPLASLSAALLAADAALMAVVAACMAASGVGHRVRMPVSAGVRLVRAVGLLVAAAAHGPSGACAPEVTASSPLSSPLAVCRAGCAGPLLLASLAEGNLGTWHLATDGAVLAAIGLAGRARWRGLAVTGAVHASWAWGAAILAAQVLVGTLLPTVLLFTWERGLRADYVDALTAARARGRCGG